MRRLLALAAVVAIGVVAMPAGAGGGPAEPEIAERSLTVDGAVATPGFVDEVEIVEDEVGFVGLKWDGDEDVELRVLVQGDDGTWEELDDVEPTDSEPDHDSEEYRQAVERRGAQHVTEPIGVSDPSRVRVEVLEGSAANVELVTVTSPETHGDRVLAGEAVEESSALPRAVLIVTLATLAVALMLPTNRRRLSTTATLMAVVMGVSVMAAACTEPTYVPSSQPGIVNRASWGANEALRNCGPSYASTVNQGVIHHTATPNDNLAPAARIRSIYSYHTQTLGWCDIGYNFLVDRNGAIYEGRRGGVTSRVIGAHTAGFNTGSFGVAVIGNYHVGGMAPTNASINALVRLFVWKMSIHNINPNTAVQKCGNNGCAMMDRIIGHRDAGFIHPPAASSCPGDHLYARMGEIRNRVKPNVGLPYGNIDSVSRQGSNVKVRGWAIDPKTQANVAVHVYVGGPAGVGTGVATVANKWRPDVGAAHPNWGNNRGYELTTPIRGPNNQACIYLINAGGPNTFLGCRGF